MAKRRITHEAVMPRNLDAATTMRFAASRRKVAALYAHGKTRWQHSCSHSTAICNQTVKKRIELRTHDEPLIAEHRGGTKKPQNARPATAAHTLYLSSPAAATLHGKTQGFVPRLSPKNQAHATSMQTLQCVLQHHVAKSHLSSHMAKQDGNIHAAIPLRSATR